MVDLLRYNPNRNSLIIANRGRTKWLLMSLLSMTNYGYGARRPLVPRNDHNYIQFKVINTTIGSMLCNDQSLLRTRVVYPAQDSFILYNEILFTNMFPRLNVSSVPYMSKLDNRPKNNIKSTNSTSSINMHPNYFNHPLKLLFHA